MSVYEKIVNGKKVYVTSSGEECNSKSEAIYKDKQSHDAKTYSEIIKDLTQNTIKQNQEQT